MQGDGKIAHVSLSLSPVLASDSFEPIVLVDEVSCTHDDVGQYENQAFEPMGVSIVAHDNSDYDSGEKSERLKRLKVQVQRSGMEKRSIGQSVSSRQFVRNREELTCLPSRLR